MEKSGDGSLSQMRMMCIVEQQASTLSSPFVSGFGSGLWLMSDTHQAPTSDMTPVPDGLGH